MKLELKLNNMTHKEEYYIIYTLIEIQEFIRSPAVKQLIKETHENNIMLKQIIKVINTWFAHHNQENENDFDRNVLANMISSVIDFNKMFKR